jgi:AcrR family transcriptional regulator
VGIREEKKELTRRRIADTAWRLFADRGFDQVSVAEIARRAEVGPATVFAYFPAKEDLLFSRLDVFEERLLAAVSGRAKGESALAAVRRHLLDTDGGLLAEVEAGSQRALQRLRTVNRVIAESPALLARERQSLAHTADALAELLAAETAEEVGGADDLRAQAAANALVGVQRALIEYTRRRVLANDELRRLQADVRRLGAEAFTLLDEGLGRYGR